MRCASCGFENPEGAKFCIECGGAVKHSCPSCGFDNLPQAKFCAVCGTALGGEGQLLAAKGRKLSVMFCDLVGSTALSSQLDPEAYREVVRVYQETCTSVIRRYDGHL